MKAVVLAGGIGERLRPLTDVRPKPLINIAGRPCIDYVLRSLVKAGFKEIVTTDSIHIPPESMLPNITVLSVGPLLGEVIRRVHKGISVGQMFNE